MKLTHLFGKFTHILCVTLLHVTFFVQLQQKRAKSIEIEIHAVILLTKIVAI